MQILRLMLSRPICGAGWIGILFLLPLVSSRFAHGIDPPVVAIEPVADFTLQDHQGRSWSLAEYGKGRCVIVAFLGIECPLAKIYAQRLQTLAESLGEDQVVVLGLDANAQDAWEEIAAFVQAEQLRFPLLRDEGSRLADQFGAVRTPEVFLLDRERRVRYRGRIDDQYGIGIVREKPLREDLRVAVAEVLANQDVSVPQTDAVGCLIGRVRAAQADATVTFAEHIAPLLHRRCVECHHAGDIAPFALTEYAEVAGWADMIAEVVRDERMPPWHAAPGHLPLADERRLSAAEKQLIADWVAAGAPAGDLSQAPAPPTYTNGWQLPREPDFVATMAAQPHTVPADGAVRYQYFSVATGLNEDRWLKAVDVQPGNRAVVHHILVFAKPPGGFDDDFGAGVHGFLAGYVPGLRSEPYPAGMAKHLPAGSELIFQIHYTPNGTEQQDLSRIGFLFADDAEITHEVRTISAFQPYLNIPRGVAAHPENAKTRMDHAVQLLGMMPHMHLRGKAFRYLMRRAPAEAWQVLLDIPEYDFNWQTNYRLAQPLPLPAGTMIKCECLYDNSADNPNNPDPGQSVTWGEQTWEEMLIGYFDVAIERTQAVRSRDLRPRQAEQFILHLDRNDDDRLQVTELPWRMRLMAAQADRDRDGVISEEELKESFRRGRHAQGSE